MLSPAKIVIGLSGGMDSTTLLASLLDNGHEVRCCIFDYGSKHSLYEIRAARKVILFYQSKYPTKVTSNFFDLKKIFTDFNSNLLKSGGDIPEGHFESEPMKLTVVPGRNLIMSSIMLGLAESIGAVAVALGVHSGDHAIYPDCRVVFIDSLKKTAGLSADGKVQILTPFQYTNKVGILNKGFKLIPQVPYALTRTCYKDQEKACGKCGSCQERLEAFEEVGVTDLIQYE